jgi:NAD(P)-dependent dehydrogenase (short-subunit alcohol dehydrogenase family)
VNRVALITGASRGIGRGIALELAKTGWDILVNFVDNEIAAKKTAADCLALATANRHTVRGETAQADVALAADRDRLIAAVKEKFGRLDLLVNNAGVAPKTRADMLAAGEESFDRLININVKGPYFLTQLAANWMIEQTKLAATNTSEAAVYRPKIVIISSVSAFAPSVNRGDYCISKAALSMMTRLYAARLAEFGINVYEIRPGIIATEMTGAVKEKYDRLIAGGLSPIERWGVPEDVGRAVAAIAENAFPFSTGEVINVDGGFHLQRL